MNKKKSAPPAMRQGLAIGCGHWAPIVAAQSVAYAAAIPPAATDCGVGETSADPAASSGRVKQDS